MIRVAFHAVAGPQGGPRTYAVALARALHARGDLQLVVLTDRPDAFPGMRCVELPGLKPWSDHFVVPRILKRLSPDVYHNTKNTLPFRVPCPAVVTIHDLAYVHFPETFTPAARSYIKVHTQLGARRAQKVICVSEHARRDLNVSLDVPDERIQVIHHGIADSFRRESYPTLIGLDKPYFLSVGTIQARKNLDVLVHAVALLRERGRTVSLVVAGRRGWRTRAFDEACKTTDVNLLGTVPDEELPSLYAHSLAFVQPSSYEGFGLTAAEAMACGAPVIAANAGSLPEVVGDAGILVPPRDTEALARALESILDDPAGARARGLTGRKLSQKYTWEKSAELHAQVYEEVAGTLATA